MKPKQKVAYFPVLPSEQAILERIREPDLRANSVEILAMLDLIAEAGVSVRELENALADFEATQDETGLDARFEALEARLVARVQRSLAEAEGRLSRRVAGEVDPVESEEPIAVVPPAGSPNSVEKASSSAEIESKTAVAVRVAGELIQGPSVAAFYRRFWMWMFDNGHLSDADLPIPSSKQRHLVAAEPVHPSGKQFFVTFEHAGVFVEMNIGRARAVAAVRKVLDATQLSYEVLVGGEATPAVGSSDRAATLNAFWKTVLAVAHERSNLHDGNAGGNEKWNWVGTKRGPYGWNYVVRQREAQVELYIDDADASENERLFDRLATRREEIEREFGGMFEWQRLPGKRACRIRHIVDEGGYRDRERWDEIADALVGAMIRMEAAFRKHVEGS